MGFEGFPGALQTFLSELNDNNNSEWFKAHRALYDASYMAPAIAFVEAIAGRLQTLDHRITAEPRINGSIRRIFRDTRFSKDKTPYQTHLHLIFWMGKHPLRAPGFHLVIGAETLGFGAGHWGFSGSELVRYREAIAKPRGAVILQAILDDAASAGTGVLDPPALKKVPSGFDKDAPGAALARHKGIVIKAMDMDPSPLFEAKALDFGAERVDAALPLVGWLADNVYD